MAQRDIRVGRGGCCASRWSSPCFTSSCWWWPASARTRWPCFPKQDITWPIFWRCCCRWWRFFWKGGRRAPPKLMDIGAREVNVRSALLQEVGDTLSTAAVIAGGFAILWTGQYWIAAALSCGIGALIIWSSFGIVRETLNILLEGTPRGISLEAVESAMRHVAGVSAVHDLHLWSIGSENHALSAHVKIADMATSESDTILREINEKLGQGFGIHHTTIQLEHVVCETARGCVIAVPEDEHEHDHSGHDHHGHAH